MAGISLISALRSLMVELAPDITRKQIMEDDVLDNQLPTNARLIHQAIQLIENQAQEVQMWQNVAEKTAANYIKLRNIVGVALAPIPPELEKLPPNLKFIDPSLPAS